MMRQQISAPWSPRSTKSPLNRYCKKGAKRVNVRRHATQGDGMMVVVVMGGCRCMTHSVDGARRAIDVENVVHISKLTMCVAHNGEPAALWHRDAHHSGQLTCKLGVLTKELEHISAQRVKVFSGLQ